MGGRILSCSQNIADLGVLGDDGGDDLRLDGGETRTESFRAVVLDSAFEGERGGADRRHDVG